MDASISMVLILLKLKISLDESKMLNLLETYLQRKKSLRRHLGRALNLAVPYFPHLYN